ncbi:MAG: NACHT domain-containing protein [Chloroflexota bacterium]
MDDKSDLEKTISILYLILTIVAPFIGGGINFLGTKNLIEALETGGLTLAVFLAGLFLYKVFIKIADRWIGRTVDNVDSWLQTMFSGFRKKYFRHLIFRHRDFDVKGLSTQGVFTLDLERIFVELIVSPQAYHRVSANILATSPVELPKGSRMIWDYLRSKNTAGTKLVILGAPGSGKTTLLKNVALVLAGSRKQKKQTGNKLPILLFLREHTEAIIGNPNVRLPEIIRLALEKYQIAPPPQWFENYLQSGACIVMLDGLDEVAEADVRRRVVAWVEKQMVTYPNNHFIVTSRPFGYRENQLNGVSVLEVLPFNIKQVKQFIDNWYLANEIQSHQKDDEGVRIKAREGADDLFMRLRKTTILLDLAVNPLLLTMIATVHRYRSSLPGRRVELYKEICEVFLGKRQGARGLELPLTPAQKQSILQPLAYYMMCNHMREIDRRSALAVFGERLKLVSPQSTGEEFLQMVENLSGLLLERENGIYGFAHKTFQEYLASVHIIEQGLEKELVSHIEDGWWHECIRLYTAQADATSVIEACIAENPPSANALTLAIACEDEAREVHPNTRRKLERVLLDGVESRNLETRNIVGEALLTLNIRDMTRLDDNTYIGKRFVNHAEYQLFLNDVIRQKKNCQPDQWLGREFPTSLGLQPIAGVRAEDGIEFCNWLTQRESGEWHFRLPTQNEIALSNADIQKDYNYWVVADAKQNHPVLFKQRATQEINPKIIDAILGEDLKVAHYMENFLGLDITRNIVVARGMLNQILKNVYQASPHDLGMSGITFDETDWARASVLARQFSRVINDAQVRMHNSFGARLFSIDSAEISLELAQQIHSAHDALRGAYLPNSYASNRADRSHKAADIIKGSAKKLEKYIKHLNADIEATKNLNTGQTKKITLSTGMNIIEITNFAVTTEPSRFASIMEVVKRGKKVNDFMEIHQIDLSELPLLAKMLNIVLSRETPTGIHPTDIKKLGSCYLRLLLIYAMTKIGMEQKLPVFLDKENSNQTPKKADLIAVVEKLKALYLLMIELEFRRQNVLGATESLRIVRERSIERL